MCVIEQIAVYLKEFYEHTKIAILTPSQALILLFL